MKCNYCKIDSNFDVYDNEDATNIVYSCPYCYHLQYEDEIDYE
jgi:hypothetical protein